ncbi:hypothetical protein GCM10010399_13010 [Dactylosporangium fulvum]|uniref:VOC family protein n=1 Tax=Dactylosporangium fulvum TaxID=53359 RepID=A0ABY5W5W5_9ACTN|nr:VOC family protein [Dactylosporangium fulvum]UWP85277.1 VOC family protein [Dactylosporangium fulvum]
MQEVDNIEGLDHTGMVMPTWKAAVAFYERAFGAAVVVREADTDVDATAIGLPGETVRTPSSTTGRAAGSATTTASPRSPGW